MGEILLKDGVRYIIHEYANEDELEKMVIEHYKEIFGENALFFNKQKIKTRSGIGTIPDGFVLSMDDNKWYIIEVELDSHPLYEHIVPQITKFNSAMKNPSSKKRMVKAFYDEIKEDATKIFKVQDENIKELYKFISETLDTKPEIIIAINSKTDELDEVCESLPFSSKIVEFKTFEKEDAPSDHVHLFEPLYKYKFKKRGEGEETTEKYKIKEEKIEGAKNTIQIQGDVIPIRYSKDILIGTANWLIKQDKLKLSDIPIEAGPKRYLINKRPIHKSGESFREPKELDNGLWIETNYSTKMCIIKSRDLLKSFGYQESDLKGGVLEGSA